MFIIQKRTSEKDYPCSLIRMHLIATSKDSIFQKEDFGWGAFIQRGGFILENSKNKTFHITYLGLSIEEWGSNQADMVSSRI